VAGTVSIPIWVAVLVSGLAALALLDRFLVPSVRWYLRRRLDRVVRELNSRLHLEIQPLKLTKREVLIDRLTYDPEVLEAVEARTRTEGVPRDVVMTEVARFAREIVPSFNAYAYFRIGYWLARRIAETLYRVRLGYVDDAGLSAVPPTASVVVVMNHRSNMDYVLVAYLAASRTALSYAVGEWARIWPLQTLIRAMGAYFVRRNSGDALYRRVLERYVHMAVEAGVAQAIYPEGGLTRDGRLRLPRLGLLAYMVKSFDPEGSRDLVFIPVGINYDRVLEDRSLVRRLDAGAERKSGAAAARTTLGFVGRNVALMLRRRWYRFGYACVSFGTPFSLRRYLAEEGRDFRDLGKDALFAEVDRLGRRLMTEVGKVVPVLPVSLIAAVFVRQEGVPLSELELKAKAHELAARIEAAGARLYIPRADRDYAVTVGLRMLTLRHLVDDGDGLYRVRAGEEAVIGYYANAIAHFVDAVDGGSDPAPA